MTASSNQVAKRFLSLANNFVKVADHLDELYLKSKNKSCYSSPDETIESLDFYYGNSKIMAFLRHNSNQGMLYSFRSLLNNCCSFRLSPICYIIDPDYRDEIKPIHLDTPSIVFERIPNLCFYVEYPIEDIQGFVVNKIIADGSLWLNINLIPAEDKMQHILKSMPDYFQSMIPIMSNACYGFKILEETTIGESVDELMNNIQIKGKTKEAARLMAAQILSVLLWFCVEEPDISDFDGKILSVNDIKRGALRKNKAGKFIPYTKPVTHVIGKRLGGEIRKFKEQLSESETEPQLLTLSKRTVRPHIRSGHWHGYWTGTDDNKHYIIKWLNAILVNTKA